MGLIREHIIYEKFVEESDAIHDMGIGLPKVLPKMINNIFVIDNEQKGVNHVTTRGNIQMLYNREKTFAFEFYSNAYYYITGDKVNKKDYAIYLLEKSGLDQFIDINKCRIFPSERDFKDKEEYSPWLYIFTIKKEYRKVFNGLEYEFKPPKI